MEAKTHDFEYKLVTCRFTASEMEIIDGYIDQGYFRNRSEAIRMLVWKALETWSPRRIKNRLQDVKK